MIGGLFLNDPQLPDADSTIPGVTIAMEQPRTVNLVFASASALDAATLTVTLPDGVKVRVWDSTAELRYLVIPERPAGTDGWDAERLAALITRDSMIGTQRTVTLEAS